jgi:hypothetical protein
MRVRSLATFAMVLVVGLRTAHADPRADIEKKIKEAMESYDLMDYDATKKLLNQALASAKRAKLDKDALAAKAYLDLGIVSFVNNDQDGARLSFLSALQIDPRIQIDPAYKSPEMAKLLDEVRSEVKGGGGGSEPISTGGGSSGDCGGVKGLEHTLVDTAKAGAAQQLEATLGADVKASKVAIMVRPEGATSFSEIRMSKQGECKYVGTIPAATMKGSLVHYYIAAFNDAGKPVAQKGSAGSPNIMELTAGGAGGGGTGGGDNENPLAGGGAKSSGGGSSGSEPSGGDTSSGVSVSSHGPGKVLIGLSAGSGFGYLAAHNTTEGGNPVNQSGFGSSLVVVQPELAFRAGAQVSIGLVGRFAIPVGANMDGHSPVGPAGLLRLRFGLGASGDGFQLMAEAGGGILRSTLKIGNTMAGTGDTDIVAQGPLLLGGGLGYAKAVSSSMIFRVDLAALAGIAVADKIGLAPMNTGLTIDLSLGLGFGL